MTPFLPFTPSFHPVSSRVSLVAEPTVGSIQSGRKRTAARHPPYFRQQCLYSCRRCLQLSRMPSAAKVKPWCCCQDFPPAGGIFVRASGNTKASLTAINPGSPTHGIGESGHAWVATNCAVSSDGGFVELRLLDHEKPAELRKTTESRLMCGSPRLP